MGSIGLALPVVAASVLGPGGVVAGPVVPLLVAGAGLPVAVLARRPRQRRLAVSPAAEARL